MLCVTSFPESIQILVSKYVPGLKSIGRFLKLPYLSEFNTKGGLIPDDMLGIMRKVRSANFSLFSTKLSVHSIPAPQFRLF